MMEYAELNCISNFTFLRGASHPEELVEKAAKLGYNAIAITDECSLAGIVRSHVAAKKSNIKLIVGSQIKLYEGIDLVLLVKNREGYENLSMLITHGRRKAKKGNYFLTKEDIKNGVPGCLALWQINDLNRKDALWLSKVFAKSMWITIRKLAKSGDTHRTNEIINFANELKLPIVAVGNVNMHCRERRQLQNILTAIRFRQPIAKLGYCLDQNGETHLRPICGIKSLLPKQAIQETIYIASLCSFSLDSLQYHYPDEVVTTGEESGDYLSRIAKEGLEKRFKKFKKHIPKKVMKIMQHELSLIRELKYEHYFLTVHDIVTFAKNQGILCQGRGSAANSVVCFALNITEVDPSQSDLLFERFISRERKEPPDIDVDFEHDRREEVIQYIYRKYGKERAALTAAVVTYQVKSAIRDIGKALGINSEKIEKLLKTPAYSWWNGDNRNEHLKQSGFDLNKLTTKKLIELTDLIIGFPRHLSQHVGGFVISKRPLSRLVPIENTIMTEKSEKNSQPNKIGYVNANRTIIQWDKNDLDALNILKIDILALGMLSVISRALKLISKEKKTPFALDDIPRNDPEVYEMISKADTIGIFQIESRAQMSMLPRLKPKTFYDLVIQIAIVRPGPIQGGMVHPYLRRRQGIDPITYPSSEIKQALQRTLGVPIFQEQVMQIAITAAGFSPGEADQLRRSISGWRSRVRLEMFKKRILLGMKIKGYHEKFARQVFDQILGFGEYGFPESHAASFALLVYYSAWLKYHKPAIFLVALLNSQPMGFYAPAQLIQDAKKHNVVINPPDVLISNWDSALEYNVDKKENAVRLGLRMIKGLSFNGIQKLLKVRSECSWETRKELLYAAQLSSRDAESLAFADTLSPENNRRSALWFVSGIEKPTSVFGIHSDIDHEHKLLPPSEGENIIADYKSIGLSLRNHPIKLLRSKLEKMQMICAKDIRTIRNRKIKSSGLVINRQRPSTSKGVLFLTLEDETGFINVVVWPKIAEKYRVPLLTSQFICVEGFPQNESDVIHLIAHRIYDYSSLLQDLRIKSRDFH